MPSCRRSATDASTRPHRSIGSSASSATSRSPSPWRFCCGAPSSGSPRRTCRRPRARPSHTPNRPPRRPRHRRRFRLRRRLRNQYYHRCRLRRRPPPRLLALRWAGPLPCRPRRRWAGPLPRRPALRWASPLLRQPGRRWASPPHLRRQREAERPHPPPRLTPRRRAGPLPRRRGRRRAGLSHLAHLSPPVPHPIDWLCRIRSASPFRIRRRPLRQALHLIPRSRLRPARMWRPSRRVPIISAAP